ncbi:KpsF/GutQ family sugar-phosphate isomerase [Pseudohoeflea coraliihabitans]|uniref:KpsF/GutQ family sugar-phosphate isomerase n=1 Tax=Pseudohoeflea coraliihabitans TaxID=2860393 RepID=A0ABS6WP48_9HYPH|nr:KpsF/GutQ family sugar-phosphate isomerase [Pseudohoeflea sp. DP4N28-3]MBW3096870.1 KpsF/GutQ family sugar-phosphate isomerase [Pseudohoeflea sp. DP4N28-3]
MLGNSKQGSAQAPAANTAGAGTEPTPEAAVAEEILSHGRDVVAMEAAGVAALAQALDEHFVAAVKALLAVKGRVVISGLGKSGHVAKKIAATLASTGTPSNFVHSAEAAHGDMGMISGEDVLILLSNSGETAELVPVLNHATALGIPVIGITSGSESTLVRAATIPLVLPVAQEACPIRMAPTTSTTMMLALGDAMAMAAMRLRGFSRHDFQRLHPGGSLGLKLMRVEQFMHQGERLPLISPDMPMAEAVMVMTSKSFGLAGVIDEDGNLIGIVSDGDLRRHMHELTTARAGDVMSTRPRVINGAMFAEDALRYLNEEKITALFVIDGTAGAERVGKPIGLVHVHDFIHLGLA